jgi:hypothetical protein
VNQLRISCLVAVLVSACVLPSVSFAADDGLRLNGGLGFGFGGQLKLKGDAGTTKDDVVPTIGFYGGLEYAFLRFLSLGGEVGLAWWYTDTRQDPPAGAQDTSRDLQLDVLARPKLRIPIGSLEVYGVVPIGLSYYFPSDDLGGSVLGTSAKLKPGPGFAAGVSAGATLFLLDFLGLNLELGYLHRGYRTTYEAKNAIGSLSNDLHGKFDQFQLRAGAVLAF